MVPDFHFPEACVEYVVLKRARGLLALAIPQTTEEDSPFRMCSNPVPTLALTLSQGSPLLYSKGDPERDEKERGRRGEG